MKASILFLFGVGASLAFAAFAASRPSDPSEPSSAVVRHPAARTPSCKPALPITITVESIDQLEQPFEQVGTVRLHVRVQSDAVEGPFELDYLASDGLSVVGAPDSSVDEAENAELTLDVNEPGNQFVRVYARGTLPDGSPVAGVVTYGDPGVLRLPGAVLVDGMLQLPAEEE